MRFLQLLCEGDNRSNKHFLRNQGTPDRINIVAAVASFLNTVSTALLKDIVFVTEPEFLAKFSPTVNGVSRSMISWFHRSDDGFPEPNSLIDLANMEFKANLMRMCCDTLTELAVGPCFENQEAICLSGVCRAFEVLFQFFGALQLIAREPNEAPIENTDALREFEQSWSESAGVHLTYEGSIHSAKRHLFWIGNDPAAFEMLYSRQKGLYQYSSVNIAASDALSRITGAVSGAAGKFSKGFITRISPLFEEEGEEEEVHEQPSEYKEIQRAKYMTFVNKLVQQKLDFIESLRRRSPLHGDGNIYAKIQSFEKSVVSLEASVLLLVTSLLEGSGVEEHPEIAADILDCVGVNNLLCNTIVYWNVRRSYL